MGGRGRAQPDRIHPERRSGVGVRGERAARPAVRVRIGTAGTGHLLRDAAFRVPARRARRAGAGAGVRARGDSPRVGLPAVRGAAAVAAGVDVPRGPDHGDAARLQGLRLVRLVAVRGDGQRPRLHRDPVPPGGRAHARRQGDHRELPVQGLRRPWGLGRRQLHRRLHQPHPRAGRRRARDLRAVGRGRLGRDRGPGAPGDRRPAHLHLRGQRPPAAGRAGARRRDVPAQPEHQPRARRRRRPLPRQPGRRHRPRARSARSSARRSSASSRKRRTSSVAPTSSPRARPTPTSSSPARTRRTRNPRWRRRSRRTTTSAGCRAR